MPAARNYFWRKAPFVRLLLAFAAGILLQWYLSFPFSALVGTAGFCLFLLLLYLFLPLRGKFKWQVFHGVLIAFLLATAGALSVWRADVRNRRDWIGHYYKPGDFALVTLQEPLVEKPNSYKALARVEALFQNNRLRPVTGRALFYFKKDTFVNALRYGTQILIAAPLQPIRNAGNPGSFDYKRYTLFQGITHQVYLTDRNFSVLAQHHTDTWKEILFSSRSNVLEILRRYIGGDKERGLAEALLIGYKDDLDKNLVQSYSNTGVVHVIAISGLHLGIIYWLLLLLTKPLKHRKISWLRFLTIVAALWLFSFLAGAQPSVLRSALMFTVIALGTVIVRRTSVYNTLALSAFLLLCINPFWLWDVGFQLSYAAVLSIIIFFRPIYTWLYFPNKALDFIWKLLAVSLAAQLLTLPISVYHFHQFPVLFLFTNLLAVPLSSVILIGEIVLCAVYFIEPVARLLGFVLEKMIRFMNYFIEQMDTVSFAVWNGLSVSVVQTVLLYGIIAGVGFWWLEKKRTGLWAALGCLLTFIILRTVSFMETTRQKKVIVYNVPKYRAIDVMDGRKCYFLGDAALLQNEMLRNFHVQPSRILHRIDVNNITFVPQRIFSFYGKRIVTVDETGLLPANDSADVLVLSKNPRLYMTDLCKRLKIKQVVIDGTVPQWKARLWKGDCDSLRMACHDVSEKGAFVMNVE